ncbi:MAG: diaminopimelate epimerase [Epsilonproteobacteria bacterium]|nr:diaminopimelate epimerase [Campylobacterota bacterium]
MFVSKYSASGNDFVIFHTFIQEDRAALARQLCHRQNGIGADGLIVLLPHLEYDFEWQFYNSDGSEAEMCGNGSRAVAHYAYTNQLAPSKMRFLTKAGVIHASVEKDVVETELTTPKLIKDSFYEDGYEWVLIDTGVPHLVALVDDISTFDKEVAQKMRHKYNANVNFAKFEDGVLKVRTYERGVEDETLACGTGMCASFLSARDKKYIQDYTRVIPTSQECLEIRIQDGKLFFKGEVKNTFNTFI